MADNENIIEDLDTLLGQPINEQPVGVPQDQHDLYDAAIDATISGDHGQMSVLNQLRKAEAQGLAGSEAWNRAAADHRLPEGTEGETLADYPNLEGAARLITGLPIETAGFIKSSIERGPVTFLQETFGKGKEGQITLSFDELHNIPDLQEYLEQMDMKAHNNEVTEYNTFVKDLHAKYDIDKMDNIRDYLDVLDEDELIKYQLLLATAQEGPDPENPIAYKMDTDNGTITLDSSLFPEVRGEPDVKITEKGDVSFPYFGLLGYDDEGNFVKKHSSIYRPFDRSEEGVGALYDYIPDKIKDVYEAAGSPLHWWQDFSSPELSPDPELFKNPGAQLAMLGLGARGVIPIARGAYRKGKNIYEGLGSYLNKSKSVPVTKKEPRLSELPWSR
jgi:hypothetical protein